MAAPEGEKSTFPIGAWPTVIYLGAGGGTERSLYQRRSHHHNPSAKAAHTDGDSMVFFRRSDVLVTGDVFDQTRFPSSIATKAEAFRE